MKQQYSNEDLQEAVNKIKIGLLSTSAAAKIYKIPRTTQIKKKEQTQIQKIKTPLVRFQKNGIFRIFLQSLFLVCCQ